MNKFKFQFVLENSVLFIRDVLIFNFNFYSILDKC